MPSPGRCGALLATFLLGLTATAPAERIAFTEYDLPNGLHVILHPEHSVPVISSYVLYHVGSKDERPDRTGFAHFFEHLMFEGSENIKRGQIDKLVSGAGGNLNASTSNDQTDYYINLPANQVGLALWIESERMMHGKIDETGVETQRKVVKEERRLRYDNRPYGSLLEEMSKLVFAGTPYAWVPIGSVQYIDQASIGEFRDFYHAHYLPNNATLSLAGDFDPEAVKKMIADYFGPIPKGAEPARPPFDLSKKPATRTIDVQRQNTPLPASMHAWLAPAETDPDSYPLEMLTNILAEGHSSRLYRRLVDKEQAAVEAQAFPILQEKAGMIAVFAVANKQVTLQRLDDLIDDEIAQARKDGVSDEELQKARNSRESEWAASYGTVQSRARALARYHVFYGNADLVNTELERYLKVTREDLQRVADEYLNPAARFVLHYPPPH